MCERYVQKGEVGEIKGIMTRWWNKELGQGVLWR